MGAIQKGIEREKPSYCQKLPSHSYLWHTWMDWAPAHLSTRFLPSGAGKPYVGVTIQHLSVGEQRNHPALWDALTHIWEHRCGSCSIFLFLILLKYLEKRGTSLQCIMDYQLIRGKNQIWFLILYHIILKLTEYAMRIVRYNTNLKKKTALRIVSEHIFIGNGLSDSSCRLA